MPHDASTALVLCDFVSSFERDCAQGRLRPLREYLARYPGHEAAIAEEHAAMVQERTTGHDLPRQLGPFEIRAELARGGQGRVYLAWDLEHHRHAAVKVLTRTGGADRARRARFGREVDLLRNLRHPQVCRFYAADVDHDPPYLAMELVPGATLASHLEAATEPRPAAAATAPVAPRDAAQFAHWLRFFASCARAVFGLHSAGIVHRDLKPANVMVTPEGEPRLLDFGAARRCDDPRRVTRPDLVIGTKPYLAPEQLHGDHAADGPRSDQFALGVTMFESLALRRPDAEVPAAVQVANLFTAPAYAWLPRPRAAAVGTILSRALAPVPSQRHFDCLTLAADLQRLHDEQPWRVRWQSWQHTLRRGGSHARHTFARLLQPALWMVLPMLANATPLLTRQHAARTGGETTTVSHKPLHRP